MNVEQMPKSSRTRTRASGRRGRSWVIAGSCAALVVTAFAVPLPASAAAKWKTHVFSVTYDGTGSYSYTAQGANGDAGCFMRVGQTASYAFGQQWLIKIGFKSTGKKGQFLTKVESILHVDGPQIGKDGTSHLEGRQSSLTDQECQQETIVPDTGKFDCKSTSLTLTAYPKPQIEVSRKTDDIVMEGHTFLAGLWDYTGTDSIPSDKKGCTTYEDMTYGSSLIPGIYSASKVSTAVSKLAALTKGKTLATHIGLSENAVFPAQTTCAAVFGAPQLCIIHSQKLSGTFRVARVR
jgi:hypothetical protein